MALIAREKTELCVTYHEQGEFRKKKDLRSPELFKTTQPVSWVLKGLKGEEVQEERKDRENGGRARE
jgi:hypothetical protein